MKNKMNCNRLIRLKAMMQHNHVDYMIVPTSDNHQSEYVCDYFKVREYISGFTGSNGTLLISQQKTILWTDGRYFIQAEKELEGTPIELYKMNETNVPTLTEYLEKHLNANHTVLVDGRVISATTGCHLEKVISEKKATLVVDLDFIKEVWQDRPSLPEGPLWPIEEVVTGSNFDKKITWLREQLIDANANTIVMNKLDEIMWLFNIRGEDIAYNPMGLSYAVVTEDETILFVRQGAIHQELISYCKNYEIKLRKYEVFYEYLEEYIKEKNILLDIQDINYAIYRILTKQNEISYGTNPVILKKAIKNTVEQEHIREVYLKDSIALTKFMYEWKTGQYKGEMTEIGIANRVDELRRQIKGFIDLSFPTISAFGANASMMHYQATEETQSKIEEGNFLLIDSGGQYVGGTTDVTRTFAIGEVTEEMRNHFTAVVSGMLQLQDAVFMEGCTGRNLDILARGPIWNLRMDYKCGTGHGIGYMLGVHEGPHSISYQYHSNQTEIALQDGMVVSNEPGIYLENQYGIRIENILMCKKDENNDSGKFLKFEPLTFVPIDLDAINSSKMSDENRRKLNEYHILVYRKLKKYLEEDMVKWLKESTRYI